ncbi:hypothetical protein GCM10009784_26820 [Arthrobacter parietis]|uniref:Uncharacterized protein n=1 Tax=Arthrobacter parietis TaxID=271434 RepID=A0ABP5MQQ0_9MICC
MFLAREVSKERPRGNTGDVGNLLDRRRLEQLAGAAGTAILVAALTVGAATASAGGAAEGPAQASRAQAAFVVGGVLAVVAVVLSLFVRRVKNDDGAH